MSILSNQGLAPKRSEARIARRQFPSRLHRRRRTVPVCRNIHQHHHRHRYSPNLQFLPLHLIR
jgi:hypothetical protein